MAATFEGQGRRARTTVVIPALDPGEELVALTGQLAGRGFRIVVVDDGSTSCDPSYWARLGTRTVVLHHGRNLGKGAALKTGIGFVLRSVLDAECVVTMDADGQHLASDLDGLVASAWERPDALVLGTRTFDGDGVPRLSSLGNRVSRVLLRMVCGAWLGDTQTGLRACGRDLARRLVEVGGERFEYETNVLMYCASEGVEMVQCPIETVYHDAQNSCSHYRRLRDTLRIAASMLRFAASSLACFLVDIALYTALLGVLPGGAAAVPVAAGAARVVSGGANYLVNRSLVFRSRRRNSRALPEYVVLACVVLLCDCALTLLLMGVTRLGPVWSRVVAESVMFLVSYAAQRTIVFPSGGEPIGGVA